MWPCVASVIISSIFIFFGKEPFGPQDPAIIITLASRWVGPPVKDCCYDGKKDQGSRKGLIYR